MQVREIQNFSYLTISDLHLMHSLNETPHIVGSLRAFFEDFSPKSKMAKLDAIFIDGDIWETEVKAKHPYYIQILLFFSDLFAFASTNDIMLRFLEGTTSHEYRQTRTLVPLAESYGDKLDFKYVDTLTIEHSERLGIDILYVPDELNKSDAAKTQQQVIDLMREKGIEKVHIAHLHGLFDIQTPGLGNLEAKHSSEFYLSITLWYINIGHDHHPAISGRILRQGSFDRMCHGEEHGKGGIICHIRPDSTNSFEFVENKLARTFKTITVKKTDLRESIDYIQGILRELPDNSHIRIAAEKMHPIFSVWNELRLSFPTMTFKQLKGDVSEISINKVKEVMSVESSYTVPAITQENVIDMIFVEMEDNGTLKEPDKKILLPELKVLL